MKHPTRQEEHITLLVKAIAIAASEVAKGDKAKARDLADRWIEEATREYGAELLERMLLDGTSDKQPRGICGHC